MPKKNRGMFSRMSMITRFVVLGLSLITLSFFLIIYQLGHRYRTMSTAAMKARQGQMKQFFSPISFSISESVSLLPSSTSGILLDGKNPYRTEVSYDNPFLTIMFWVYIDSRNTNERAFIFGNRELGCVTYLKGIGFAIYYEPQGSKLLATWRGREDKCPDLIISKGVKTNTWTHVAVTMYTTDADFDTAFEDVVYPMNADFYINGVMSTSVYSLRFIVDTYKPYIVGMSPSGKDGFVGRVFNLMVINYDLKKETIRAVYKGDGSVVSQLQSQAVLVMGTNEFDIGGAGKKE